MSGLLALKQGLVYGPVQSRRLGRSLGLNPLGGGRKVCTFDCGYCQYGWSDPVSDGARHGGRLPTAGELIEAVEGALARLVDPPAYLTFSGNGEPTLHPDFPELVDGIVAVRDRLVPGSRTAVLSNSSRAADPAIRGALARLDVRIMKLDCGTEEVFRRFNRPARSLTLDRITAALAELGEVTLQSLFTAGPGGNSAPDEVEAWLERLDRIRPIAVQVYTLDRGWPDAGLAVLGPNPLEAIAAAARSRGHRAAAFSPPR